MLQGDFGGIYFKSPSNIFTPQNTKELSQTNSSLFNKKIPWVVRNTGHSVNGQTLTNGFQVDLSLLKKITFDEKKMEVTVGAGNTWSEVFEAIKFPKYSLPLFPNNPGQKIQIGGTVSVGGIGPYAFKYGGLWNWVKKITLVLPSGDIVETSEVLNPELFKYSIAGFGKIGTISEITLQVIRSREKIAMFEIIDYSNKKYFSHIQKILKNPKIVGASGISKGDKMLGFLEPNALMLILESNNMLVEMEELKKELEDAPLKLVLKEHPTEFFTFGKKFEEINKKTIFEYYPIDLRKDHTKGTHPWSDYIFDFENYQKFIPFLRDVISHYDLEKYIITQTFFNGAMKINIMPTYICKNLKKDFPLAPEVNSDFSYGIGLMPTIPENHLEKSLEAIKVLTSETYKLKGKRYLYGIHSLSEENLINQYGENVLKNWRKLKKDLDPHNLLNSLVIFQ
jgi:hypothetical protein